MVNTQKNNTLELIKLFAAYMVVFIHVPFQGKMGDAIDALSRFAVPFFFLVSGYYSHQISCEKIKKRIKNIFSLFVFSAIFCTVFEIIVLLKFNGGELISLFHQYADFSTYVKIFLFNMPMRSGHLWYLLAALYVYVIFYFTTKFRVKEKVIFAVSFLLLLLHIVLGEGLSAFGIVHPIYSVRNFALMGIPFFALGLFVKKYEDKFAKLPNYMILAFIVIGAFESVASRFLFGENELHVGSLLVLAGIVCIFIQYADTKCPSFLTRLAGCSTYIYVFHLSIATALLIIYGVLGIDIYSSALLENLHPVVVCIASTVFASLFIKGSKLIKTRKRNL